MSKKPKVIPTLFKDLETQEWWEYKEYNEKEIESIDDWFKKQWKEVQTILPNNLIEDIQVTAKSIGTYVHPYFKAIPDYLKDKEQDNKQAQEQQQQGGDGAHQEQEYFNNRFILMNNQRVDYLTFKILSLIWPLHDKFNVLKCLHNNFSPVVLNQLLQFVTNPANRIFKFFLEWNPLPDTLRDNFYTKLLGSAQLEFLVLRGGKITDDTFILICDALQSNPSANLKYLDLYDNQIGAKGMSRLGELITTYTKFEYLGFGKNNLTCFADIQPVMKQIGKIKMTPEMIEHRQKQIQEREDTQAKWTKAKKKFTDDMLPKVDPVTTLIDGSMAKLLNPQLRMFNIQLNQLGDDDRDYFEKMQNMLADDFQVVLVHNNFEPKSRDKIRKKLHNHVYI